jgi:SAM-dependent methyltransferase
VVTQAESTATLCPLGCTELRVDPERLRDNRFGLPYEVRIAWCGGCGLGVTLDAPPRSELDDLYERAYPQEGLVPRAGRAARVWHVLNGSLPLADRVRSGPVLDIGCNTGELLAALRRRGLDVVGLEPNGQAAGVARRRGLEVIAEPIEDAELPTERFASVLLSQVLEHVEEPRLVLQKVRATLRPDGVAHVVVPNAGSAWRRLFGPQWAHWHVPFHLYHHTERSLRLLCAQSGLTVRRIASVTPGEYVLLSLAAWRNSRRGRYEVEPFTGRYGRRLLVAPPARLLDALGRGDALYAEAVPSSRS